MLGFVFGFLKLGMAFLPGISMQGGSGWGVPANAPPLKKGR